MKRVSLVITVVFLLTGLGMVPHAPVKGVAYAQDDLSRHPSCPYCGMNRTKFAHSRIYTEYEDGATFGACSLHCAAVSMAVKLDKAPRSVWAGDYNTRKLVDAEKAFWVIGGSKMGVMTKRAKWAFEAKGDADQFIQQYGGRLSSLEEAIKASYEDMYEDTRMIREKRKMMKKRQMSSIDH